jgi:pyruvate/2-oxoglutarate dehydrogenase complex dihydrolipoamide acyltransferase (E2) component
MLHVFHMPDLGNDQPNNVVGHSLVRIGDWVKVNQPLAEVENDKAVTSITSPVAGRVVELHWEGGQVVACGMPLVTLEIAEDADLNE